MAGINTQQRKVLTYKAAMMRDKLEENLCNSFYYTIVQKSVQ